MTFSVAGVCTSFAALAMAGSRPTDSSRIVYGSGTLDRLCKLDMEQHCKWMVYGPDGFKGCTRMRTEVAQLGHAFRITGFVA